MIYTSYDRARVAWPKGIPAYCISLFPPDHLRLAPVATDLVPHGQPFSRLLRKNVSPDKAQLFLLEYRRWLDSLDVEKLAHKYDGSVIYGLHKSDALCQRSLIREAFSKFVLTKEWEREGPKQLSFLD